MLVNSVHARLTRPSTAFLFALSVAPTCPIGMVTKAHMTSESQQLSDEEMRRTWALVDILTSLSKKRATHPPPTAELIRRKFEALSLPALDTLTMLVDQTIAQQHCRLSQSQISGMARAVRSFPEETAAEVAYAHACGGKVVSDATVKAASVQASHVLRVGFEHLGVARDRGMPLCPIASDRHTHALDTLAKDRTNNKGAALELLNVDDAVIPEDGGFVSSKGLLIGAACCIAMKEWLDQPGDLCCGSCYRVVMADELEICRRCGDQLLCRACLAGPARHATECRRVRDNVRSAAQFLVPRLRESARQVAVVRLNGAGLIVPVHITSIPSPLFPTSLAEALTRFPDASLLDTTLAVHWRLLVSFLAKLEGDDQEAIDYEGVHHVQAAEYAVDEEDTQPTSRRAARLLPSERRRLQKETKAAERRAKEEARAAAAAAAIAEANAVLERQSARPDATSEILTSVLLKRGGIASPEVVERARAKRDSLKATEMRARKSAKAKPEEISTAAERMRVEGELIYARLVAAALLLQRRARTWLRSRKKLRRKKRSRAAKLIQLTVRTWLLLRVAAKPYITSTAASSGSEGANGEELFELPKLEPPRPASTNPATTECAICLDGDAEYAVVPCGHRCLCFNCSNTVFQCPVCRTQRTAVLRVFV